MRLVLIILFIALWFSNTKICYWVYPEASLNYDDYNAAIFLKHKIYELMFLVALSLPFFKKTKISKALTIGTLLLVGASLIDKAVHQVYSYHAHDVIVIAGSIFVTLIVYKYETANR